MGYRWAIDERNCTICELFALDWRDDIAQIDPACSRKTRACVTSQVDVFAQEG
jgi:hypothetical protein